MRKYQNELSFRRVDVKVLTFDNDSMARMYQESTNLPWPILIDKDQACYNAYGMGRANWWQLINPLGIAKYVALMFRGFWPGKPGRDLRQLGGDVLIDPHGVIQLQFRSKHPHDRPSVQHLLECVDDWHSKNT